IFPLRLMRQQLAQDDLATVHFVALPERLREGKLRIRSRSSHRHEGSRNIRGIVMVPSFEAAAATMDGPDPSPARDGMGTRVVSRLQGLSAAAARQVIATAQALEAGRPDVARAHLAPAMASHPSHPEVLRLHAGMLDLQGDHRGALADMQRAFELQPDLAIAWFNLGVMLTRCVRHREATAALERAVEIAPDHVAARALLGDMLRVQDRIQEARAQY